MKDRIYEPFGDEWKAEMMKLKKADIIEFYRKALHSFQGELSKPFPAPSISEGEIVELWNRYREEPSAAGIMMFSGFEAALKELNNE